MQYPARSYFDVGLPQAPLSPEMFAGNHPDSPRLFLAPRIPLPMWDPSKEVFGLPFSPEEAGYHPDRPQLAKALQTTRIDILDTIGLAVEFASGFGYQPSQPRLSYPQHLQPLHQNAHQPETACKIEEIQGSHPDQARLFLAPRLPVPAYDPNVVFPPAFTAEQFAGNIPSQPRLFIAPRIPLPLGNENQTNYPISPEMLAGWRPDSPRLPFLRREPLPLGVVPPDRFLNEFLGYHPDTPRIFLGPQIGLPIAQTSFDQAPLSVEMFQGYHPDFSNIFRPPHFGYITGDYRTVKTKPTDDDDQSKIRVGIVDGGRVTSGHVSIGGQF